MIQKSMLTKLLECDSNNNDCIKNLYQKRPGEENALEIFKKYEEKMSVNVKFKQWITKNRTEKVKVLKFESTWKIRKSQKLSLNF